MLEHTSGLCGPSVTDVATAFKNAGLPALPVTPDMVNAYVASQPLVSEPGQVQVYSSLGYYLLGQVVLKVLGFADLATALQDNLLDPLGITRIRAGVDLLADQPADEARYQAATLPDPVSDLAVAKSLMTPDQPLVATGYGDDGVALSGGGGGLSGAATDVARLVAILLDRNDNPALKRVTLEQMLSEGAVLVAAQSEVQGPQGSPRAGFGLDWSIWRSSGVYYGQKGGQTVDAASVAQFDGQAAWGFVALFGTRATQPGWYADWPAVMNIAKKELATATDLFPQFGMPSL